MLLDKNNMFSDAQSIATTVGTVVCDKSVDLGAAGTDNLGNTPKQDAGLSDIELLCQVTTTVTSGGAATVWFQVIQSDHADLSSPDVLHQTPAIALATLAAGYQVRTGIVPGITKRYIGMQYIVGGATTTAGKVTSGLISPNAKQTSYSF